MSRRLERTAEDVGVVAELFFITIPSLIFQAGRDAIRQLRW